MIGNRIEQGLVTAKDVLFSRRFVTASVAALALVASGCNQREMAAHDVQLLPELIEDAPTPTSHLIIKPKLTEVVGPSYNELKYFPPVKPGGFQETSIFGLAAYLQEQANDAYESGECNRPYGIPGLAIYAYVQDKPRAIGVTYSPGDEYLHGSVGSLPEGAKYDRNYFGFFDRKPYELPVKHYKYGMEGDRYSDLAFKIPKQVGHPSYIKYPCDQVTAHSKR